MKVLLLSLFTLLNYKSNGFIVYEGSEWTDEMLPILVRPFNLIAGAFPIESPKVRVADPEETGATWIIQATGLKLGLQLVIINPPHE